TFSYAPAELSERNALTSSGVGGRPMRSKYTRRSKAVLLAGGAGARPFFSSLSSTNASMGFFTQAAFFTFGTAGILTGWNDQNFIVSALTCGGLWPWTPRFPAKVVDHEEPAASSDTARTPPMM